MWLKLNDWVQIIQTFLKGEPSPFASALRERENNIYVAWGTRVVYGGQEIRSFNDLYDFILEAAVKEVGQTSAQTTVAFDVSARSETRFDFHRDVPSVSSLSKLIQASPSFKTKASPGESGGIHKFD